MPTLPDQTSTWHVAALNVIGSSREIGSLAYAAEHCQWPTERVKWLHNSPTLVVEPVVLGHLRSSERETNEKAHENTLLHGVDLITLRACARAVCCCPENRDTGYFKTYESWRTQNCQNRRKMMYLCLCLLLTIHGHKSDKSWILYATPIRHTYGGKGRRVINYNPWS